MHENLRTTVNLTPEWNEVKNNPYESDQWQTLGGGFRFNTFFTIYGNFRGTTNSQSNFVPNKCDLFIQNYNGAITLGLSKLKPPTLRLVYNPLIDDFMYNLTINLIPLYANEYIIDQEISILQENSSYFSGLSEAKREESGNYFTGIPRNAIMNLNIEFEDLSNVLIHDNASRTNQSVFDKSDLRKSVFIDAHDYHRDGDQLMYKNYNSVTKFDNNRIQKSSYTEDHYKSILNKLTGTADDKWTRNIMLDGTFIDLGCHPGTIKVTF